MTEREKLVELISDARINGHRVDDLFYRDFAEDIADHLVANSVTFKTTPVTYERLLKIARKMHCWIFLNVGDEQEVYDKLGLTDEENAILGYSGQMAIFTNERG